MYQSIDETDHEVPQELEEIVSDDADNTEQAGENAPTKALGRHQTSMAAWILFRPMYRRAEVSRKSTLR